VPPKSPAKTSFQSSGVASVSLNSKCWNAAGAIAPKNA
jgi:hypothetical protein